MIMLASLNKTGANTEALIIGASILGLSIVPITVSIICMAVVCNSGTAMDVPLAKKYMYRQDRFNDISIICKA